MNNGLALAVLLFALSGLIVTPLTITETFADSSSSQKGNGNKTANGCSNGTAKNNPHCSTEPSSQFTACDTDESGAIEADEVPLDFGDKQALINNIENQVGSKGQDKNGDIDTRDELTLLNQKLQEKSVDPCE